MYVSMVGYKWSQKVMSCPVYFDNLNVPEEGLRTQSMMSTRLWTYVRRYLTQTMVMDLQELYIDFGEDRVYVLKSQDSPLGWKVS